jgi:hypothetical protein
MVDACPTGMKSGFQALAVCLAILGAAEVSSSQTAPANPTAQQLADFNARAKAYADLRDAQEHGVARPKRTDDPAKLVAAQKALAAKIRVARATAKYGDILTPPVRPIFRSLLKPPLKGRDGADNKAAVADDSPAKLPLEVNTEYPSKQPLSTVPPDILKALPTLPEDIEYRFVGKHMILYDARSNLIIDFMLNAIP